MYLMLLHMFMHMMCMLIYARKNKTYATIKLNQTTLRLFHWHGKAKNRSHFMRLHALPQLGLWFVANAKTNVQTIAADVKKKGVCVQLNAILVQGMNRQRLAWVSGGFEQAELFLCVYEISRSAFIHMRGVHAHIYAIPEQPCNSGAARAIPVWPEFWNGPEHISDSACQAIPSPSAGSRKNPSLLLL